MKNIASLLLLSTVFCPSAFAQIMPRDADIKVWSRAIGIHRRAIIVDGHNDIPTPMADQGYDLGTPSTGKFHDDGDPFHSDLTRFKASGITGEFFSIYVSGTTLKTGGAMRRAMELIDVTYRATERYPDQLAQCTTTAEIRRAKRQGRMCVLMGIEGGYAIENSLAALREFYRLGVRYMTLTHNVTHEWADAHHDEERNNGLSEFGREVVSEMNRLGMFIDISHVSTKVMNDVLDISTAPIIASHSSARALNDHTRNIGDDVLRRIAKNGGVVMINFYPSFLDGRTKKEEDEREARLKPQVDKLRRVYADNQPAFYEAQRKLYDLDPIYVAPYTRIVDHMDHIRSVAGIDHIGIGSDFDGIPFLPAGMNGAEHLVLVTYEMLRRGYTEREIRKVLGENVLRAMSRMEDVARIGTRKISGEGNLKKIK